MKVLHVLASSKYSGAENIACQIIKMFPEEEMAYCSPTGAIEKKLKEEQITYIPIQKLNRKQLKKVMKEYKPDIVHAHDFKASILASTIMGNFSIISHIHNNASWIKKVNLNSIIYACSSLRFQKIITVSDSIEKEYVFRKWIKNKVCMMGNPIALDNIVKKSQEKINNIPVTDIIYLGRLAGPKNPLRFIEIIAKVKEQIPEIKAIMVGDGSLKEICTEKRKNLHLEDTIQFYGFSENPYPILKNSKILCVTSKWEGFGLSVIEAMALGKPVVATKVGGIPEILNESCGKLCEEDEEFVDEIVKLLSQEEYYLSKAKSCLENVTKLENVKKYKEQLKKIYTKEIRGKNGKN